MKLLNFVLPIVLLMVFQTTAEAQRPKPDQISAENGAITIQPIHHGTLALSWNGTSIYLDPTGGKEAFSGLDKPNLILITDIHGDHMNIETLEALDTESATVVAPQAVKERLPAPLSNKVTVLSNGENIDLMGMGIRAIPMYNLPKDEDSRHPKGRGNGYILTMGGKNVYISGDTEDIEEMRSLTDIDVAFVCMNLPYTMDINQAASAVLDFKPSIVYPFHYRGQDTEVFKDLVNSENEDIEVRLRNWYSE
ncbi:MBL fold metallo-hydrolase [Balneolaceae bacterium YR4-1]|uniref:MBL fold metallo-hydrolase n=1 Tax=Halalkalibaculum roseum TaxID=2709311 RepID=A0A6M1SY17_9BACT|nr:MBL fold metallo-hydrolase [Halalkalibaculum roseum]NGP77168.1 MBL fold metallo-hydrolase [Halalkalibaculum roseum]